MTTIYVIFDQYGDQVFFTRDEKYANFDNMNDQEFIKDECYIAKDIPGFNGQNRQACLRDITTGEITLYTRPKDWKPKRDILNDSEKPKNLNEKFEELSSSFNEYKIEDEISEQQQETKQILNLNNIEQIKDRLTIIEEKINTDLNDIKNKQEEIIQILNCLTGLNV